MERLAVTLPPGMQPGQRLQVQHAGQMYEFTIPHGVQPGSQVRSGTA